METGSEERTARPSTSAAASTSAFSVPPPPPLHSIYSPAQPITYSVSSPMYTRGQSSTDPQWPSTQDMSGSTPTGAAEGTVVDAAGERRQLVDDAAHGMSNLSLASVLEDVGGYGQNRRSTAYDSELPPPAYDSINWSGPTFEDRGASVL